MSQKLTSCKTCGAAAASNAKVCPSCGAKIPKPIYKKWWFYALIIVVLAAVIPSGGNGKKSGGATDDNPPPPPAVSEKDAVQEEATQEPSNIFSVGQSLETKYLKLTYQECEADWKGYSKYFGPKDGNKIIRAYFVFENISSSDQGCGAWDFSCYADGVSCEQFYFSSDEALTSYENISSGRKLIGNVYFEVPRDAQKIEIEYETNYWTSNKAVFIVE